MSGSHELCQRSTQISISSSFAEMVISGLDFSKNVWGLYFDQDLLARIDSQLLQQILEFLSEWSADEDLVYNSSSDEEVDFLEF